MTAATKLLIETALRHVKGMIEAFERWVKGQETTP